MVGWKVFGLLSETAVRLALAFMLVMSVVSLVI